MIVRLVVQTTLWLALMAAVLFVPAGTLAWPGAWILLAAFVVAAVVVSAWLLRYDPELLRERLGSLVQRGQEAWDRAFIIAFMILWHAWLVVMALDAARFGWSRVPAWLQAAGVVLIALGMVLTVLTFRENSYAAPVVRIQRERGQHVISTGPYGYVRHPMYAGALCLFIGMPLVLGSWVGLAATPLLIALLAWRAVREERMLAKQLEGYRACAARVRYRFMPLVW